MERLTQGDPRNAQWQDNLASVQGRIGDALMAQGDRQGALQSYRAELAIMFTKDVRYFFNRGALGAEEDIWTIKARPEIPARERPLRSG
jgi:hypothetical protein